MPEAQADNVGNNAPSAQFGLNSPACIRATTSSSNISCTHHHTPDQKIEQRKEQKTDLEGLNFPIHRREPYLARLEAHIIHILDFRLQPPGFGLKVIGHCTDCARTFPHEFWIQACFFRGLLNERVERGRPAGYTTCDRVVEHTRVTLHVTAHCTSEITRCVRRRAG